MKYLISAVIILCIASYGCSSEEKRDTPPAKTYSDKEIVSESNSRLAKAPYEEGFAYKSASIAPDKFDRWAAASIPLINSVLNRMPEGYIFLIKGHSDASVSETPSAKNLSNQTLSELRAKTIFDGLRRKGITSDRMQYKGVGTDEPLEGIPPTDPGNRRVSFELVKKS